MKFLTAFNHSYLYTADWYDFTGANDDREYKSEPSGTIRFSGGDGISDSIVIYTPSPLRDNIRLSELRDKNDNLLFPVEYQPGGVVYEVRSCIPNMNIWGTNEGYRMLLVRIS